MAIIGQPRLPTTFFPANIMDNRAGQVRIDPGDMGKGLHISGAGLKGPGWVVGLLTCVLACGPASITALGDAPTTTPSTAPSTAPASAPSDPASAEPLREVAVLGDPAFRHAFTVTGLKALSDGSRLLSCGRDGTARLWDIRTGRELARFVHKNMEVWDAAVLPDGRRFLTTSEKAVVLWDMASPRPLKQFDCSAVMFRVAVDERGERFVAGGQDGQCAVWSIADGEKLAELPRDKDKSAVYTVVMDRGGRRVISAGDDKAIKSWAVEPNVRPLMLKEPDPKGAGGNRKDKADRPNDTGSIFTLAQSPDASRILVCCDNRGPWMMDARTGKEIWRVAVERPAAAATGRSATKPADANAADSADDGDSGEGDDSSRNLGAHCAAWSPDGQAIAVVATKGQLSLRTAFVGAVVWRVDLPRGDHYGVTFSADGRSIFCASGNLIMRFDARNGERLYPAAGESPQQSEVNGVAAAGGKIISCDDADGICVRTPNDGAAAVRLLRGMQADNLSVSDDGKVALVKETAWPKGGDGSARNNTVVLDVQTGRELLRFGKEQIDEARLTHDGRSVVGECRGGLKMLRLPDGNEDCSVDLGLSYNISRFVVSPDDTEVAVVGSGKVVLVALPSGHLAHEAAIRDCRGCAYLPPVRRQALAGASARRPSPVAAAPPTLLVWTEKELTAWQPVKTDVKPLDEAQARRWIAELGSDDFEKRDKATKGLIEAGSAVMPLVKATVSNDLETRERLAMVLAGISTGSRQFTTIGPWTSEKDIVAVAASPDGRHWAAACGESPDRRIVLGEIHDGQFRVLRDFVPLHAPGTLTFDDAGRLVTGNGNGTVSIYDVPAGE